MNKYSAKAKARQIFLKKQGFYKGKIDGLFGIKSKKADRAYRQSIGELTTAPTQMSLKEHRWAFTADVAKLINYALLNFDNYQVAADDVKSNPDCGVHMKDSQHYKSLAIDLLLYILGRYCRKTDDYIELGDYWESLSPYNRWGGRYGDGNHFERLESPWR